MRRRPAKPAARWECLGCASVCDLDADDFCPACGRPLPLAGEPEAALDDAVRAYEDRPEGEEGAL